MPAPTTSAAAAMPMATPNSTDGIIYSLNRLKESNLCPKKTAVRYQELSEKKALLGIFIRPFCLGKALFEYVKFYQGLAQRDRRISRSREK